TGSAKGRIDRDIACRADQRIEHERGVLATGFASIAFRAQHVEDDITQDALRCCGDALPAQRIGGTARQTATAAVEIDIPAHLAIGVGTAGLEVDRVAGGLPITTTPVRRQRYVFGDLLLAKIRIAAQYAAALDRPAVRPGIAVHIEPARVPDAVDAVYRGPCSFTDLRGVGILHIEVTAGAEHHHGATERIGRGVHAAGDRLRLAARILGGEQRLVA